MRTEDVVTTPQRILGVDFGQRRIGLAISDPTATVAQPLGYVTGGVEEVLAVARARAVSAIVVGVPRRLDGSESDQTRATQAFVTALESATTLPVVRWDERLTTREAERVLVAGGVRRRQRREKVDQLAAQLILQSYLDATHSQRETDH